MFEFHWPWAALLLLLPFLLPRLWPEPQAREEETLEGQRLTLLHPHPERLQAAYHARRPGRRVAGWVHLALLGLLWASLVLALMRPQWLTPHTEVSSPGYDLLLAVDTSHSMEALDFSAQGLPINRMAVVKGVMGRFIDGREGDRVGLIVFGSQAFVLAPLTLDRRATRQLLDGIDANIAGPGTALGDAIALGAKPLEPETSTNYSLGAVFYRCIVGRPPFAGTTTQILHAHVYDPLTIPDELVDTLPPLAVHRYLVR